MCVRMHVYVHTATNQNPRHKAIKDGNELVFGWVERNRDIKAPQADAHTSLFRVSFFEESVLHVCMYVCFRAFIVGFDWRFCNRFSSCRMKDDSFAHEL